MSPKDFFRKYLKFQRKKKQEETDKSKPAPTPPPVKSTRNSIPDVVEQLQKRPVNRPKSTRPRSTYTSPQAANDGWSSATGAYHGWLGAENGVGGTHHDSGCSSGDGGGCDGGGDGGGDC
ncbi:hypothetical protein FPOAC2_11481 [Fusarium poae]|jgi:hypothetical protein|uniref:hypothetical protein n=1 Tax=Fusarium poae TaxID=36050 RepID=UPI001CE90F89|nr:hypothetical protein FPOAC1_011176 [Fusarium poae]KAG8666371.1 hypothetical protein FPOAC1_011176 [Fusarium poae]